MNAIAWLEYELTYYDSAVHRFKHYTTRTPRKVLWTCAQNTQISTFLIVLHEFFWGITKTVLNANFRYYLWVHGFVWFYGISNRVDYLMPKLRLYIYIRYMISKHIQVLTFLNEPEQFFCTQLNGFTHLNLIRIILCTIIHFFANTERFSSIAILHKQLN